MQVQENGTAAQQDQAALIEEIEAVASSTKTGEVLVCVPSNRGRLGPV